ncbi:unnamed protein product, partial [Prorocentrum cordatum]
APPLPAAAARLESISFRCKIRGEQQEWELMVDNCKRDSQPQKNASKHSSSSRWTQRQPHSSPPSPAPSAASRKRLATSSNRTWSASTGTRLSSLRYNSQRPSWRRTMLRCATRSAQCRPHWRRWTSWARATTPTCCGLPPGADSLTPSSSWPTAARWSPPRPSWRRLARGSRPLAWRWRMWTSTSASPPRGSTYTSQAARRARPGCWRWRSISSSRAASGATSRCRPRTGRWSGSMSTQTSARRPPWSGTGGCSGTSAWYTAARRPWRRLSPRAWGARPRSTGTQRRAPSSSWTRTRSWSPSGSSSARWMRPAGTLPSPRWAPWLRPGDSAPC